MRPCLVLVLCSALLAGCGGGGGGGGQARRSLGDTCPGDPPRTLVYTTTWGAAPASASQVVQILDATGNVLRSDSVNRGGQASSTLTVTSFPASVYELRSTLYALPDANGAVLGTANVVVDLCGSSPDTVTVRTTAAEAARGLAVDPSRASLRQQQTKRFLATGLSGSGTPVFLPLGAVTWSVLGGIGSVSPQGVFTAQVAGSGQVVARVAGQGLSAEAQVTVDTTVIRKGKWTVLVYMNAANDLAPASDLNINQMESVAGNQDVRFVVQWKESKVAFPGSTFDGVRRYLVKPDNDPNTINSELVQNNLVDGQGRALDMGNPQTLLDFVQWGRQFYPADRYVLVVWNHGNGWQRRPGSSGGTRGVSYDDQYGTRIDTWQLDQALAGQHFDILAWDASLMQMFEVAYEARGHASYVVGSEESPPAEGYPYDAVFREFRDAPGSPTAQLTKGFVDGMMNNPPYANRKITQSVIDVTKLPALASAVGDLGQKLFANRVALQTVIPQVRDTAQSYSPNSVRFYRDLSDVCRLLIADAQVPAAVKASAASVQNAVAACLVWEGHNSQSPKSSGVSIDFSSGGSFQQYRPDYIRLKLAKDTFWDEYLGAAP